MGIIPLTVQEITISYMLNDKRKQTTHLKSSQLAQITCAKDATEVLRTKWEGMEHVESFYVLLLNRANKVLGISLISKGGLAGTVADPKVIFQTALKANASGIILAHNHPSGNLTPSEADIKLTSRLKQSGSFLDLPVLDHIIISEDGFLSFAEDGLL